MSNLHKTIEADMFPVEIIRLNDCTDHIVRTERAAMLTGPVLPTE